MSYSKEIKIWYLTEEGWLGEIDRSILHNEHSKIHQKEYAAKYHYIEEYSSMFDRRPIIKTVCVEIHNDSLRSYLISIYGECPKSF